MAEHRSYRDFIQGRKSLVRKMMAPTPRSQAIYEDARKRDFTYIFRMMIGGTESEPPRTTLIDAITKGSIDDVKELLENGANPDDTWIETITNLKSPELESYVQALSDATPLRYAIRSDSPEMVELLLKCGALPNRLDTHGRTALHYAVASDRLEIAKMLLKYGADPNIKDKHDRYALDYKLYYDSRDWSFLEPADA